MTPDDIAQRFERRKDFDLVDVSPVALPMYVLTLDCVCCVHRPFPPIALFTLRAIGAGISDETNIAGYLGLDEGVARTVIAQLLDDSYLSRANEGQELVLTAQGERVLQDEKEYFPQEEMHTVLFDGLLRRPVWLSNERLLRPSELDRIDTIEIRPYPGAPPEIDELNLADVTEVLRRQHGGVEEFGRDVLAISRLARRARVFRSATGLAYRAKRGPDTQFAFVVDGVPNAELEQLFAERGGPKKMGFIKALSIEGVERNLRRHLGADVTSLLPRSSEFQEKRQLLAGARLGYDIAQRRLESDPNEENRARASQARNKLDECDRALRQFRARPLAVYEPRTLLNDALASARDVVQVAVTELWKARPGRELLNQIERALARGVRVHVVELLRREEGLAAKSARVAPELARLVSQNKNFRMTKTRRKGFFFLIKDNQFAAVANRALVGPGHRVRMFHQFAGYLLQSPELVKAYTIRLAELLQASDPK